MPPGSRTWCRRRWPTGSRPSGSPTTGTCTASWTSTPHAATPASIRSSAPRPTWPPSRATSGRSGRGKVDDTGGDVAGGEKLYYHLTLLAESTEGYRNLLKLSSAAYLEGYYYKPRLDWELLERHTTGLIATTGCLGGVVLQALLADDRIKAETLAGRLQDIFGKGNLFVELQDHGLPEQHKTNPALVEIARRIGAPLLATNDSHYTHREDHVAHDALLCVQTGALIDDPKRFKFEGEEHYLKSAAEMRHLFSELPEACDNTLLIAERANVEIDFGRPSLPQFPVPDEFVGVTYEERAAAYLRHLSIDGAKERYGIPIPAEVMQRLDYELGVIGDMGFSAYFLVVWDLIRFARSKGIRVGPGRGSAAGCCVAYCLQIVDLDPIRYDLLFERFLNPGRIQMPDIDMDFDERYRGDMIKYAAERYGSDHVAQIVTFSTIKARAAVRDAARVLGYPYIVGDKIAKAMPPLMMGRDTPLAACLDRTEGHEDGFAAAGELRTMYETDPEAKKVIDVAKGLEGLRRQDGIHAAAVVITDEPLTEYVPIQRKPDSNNPDDAPIVTQYEMHGVEDLGLLKMDFLGLRNLSVIERALDLIEVSTGDRPDIDAHPPRRPSTFAMLRQGDSMGVFQLEGGPMRSLMRSLAPTSFDDVAALVALYRPGPDGGQHAPGLRRPEERPPAGHLPPPRPRGDPRRHLRPDDLPGVGHAGGPEVRRLHLAEADNLRKACGKKIRALIQAEREKFVAGCVATGYGEELGTELFDIIEPFADYAFNKSHSYGYGFIAYQTAWLKAHYPVEYFASLLTRVKDNKDKTAVYLGECRSIGIEVLVPDVNRSLAEFAADFSAGEGDDRGLGRQARGHHLRPGRGAQRGRGPGRAHRGRAGGPRALRRLLRLLSAGRPPGPQQADHRVADQGRRLRLPGPPPPGSVPGLRGDRGPHPRAPARARCRRGVPVRLPGDRDRGPDHRVRRHPDPDPRHRVRQEPAPGLRKGDARPLHQRPSADGPGGLAGPADRLHAGRAARRRPRPPGLPPGLRG